MGLKLKIKRLDEVPEQLRELYVQDGNNYRLDLEEPPQDIQEQLEELSEYNENLTMSSAVSQTVRAVARAALRRRP